MAELKDFASSMAIVVSSCDKFFDAWRPFAFFFRKFWPDCPFPVYLIVNRLRVRSNWIRAINVGKDKGWASNMKRALGHVAEPYILYTQEDYFLTAPVDRQRLAADIAYAFTQDAASFRFSGRDPEEIDFVPINDQFGIIPRDSEWRTLCQVTLWKRDVFVSALRPGETAWNMEARGGQRTRDFLALSYARPGGGPIHYLRSAISRGLWTREALALCQQHHFAIRPAFRPSYVSAPASRRFRRAINRVTFALAFAKQLMQPLDLDASP
ncbi:MAG: hypothetical protein QOE73_35 [Verrucomicrobiota bacterium]